MSEIVTLFDNGDFSYLVEIGPTFWETKTGFTVDIYSRRRSAKNPSEARQCFFACLDRKGLESLGLLINDQLAKYDESYLDAQRRSLKQLEDFSRQISSVFRNGADLSGFDTP